MIYHLNGGENNPVNPSAVTGATNKLLLNATREGYEFLGWYGDEELKTPRATTQPYNFVETEIHFYAKWGKIYTLSYVSNIEGMKLAFSWAYTPPASYTEGFINDIDIGLQQFTVKGYLFRGWTYEGKNEPTLGDGNEIVRLPEGTTGDKVFTAHFLKQNVEEVGATLEDGGNSSAILTVPAGVEEVIIGEQFMNFYVNQITVHYEGDVKPNVIAPADVTSIIYDKVS